VANASRLQKLVRRFARRRENPLFLFPSFRISEKLPHIGENVGLSEVIRQVKKLFLALVC
jgi:hypothetical protein